MTTNEKQAGTQGPDSPHQDTLLRATEVARLLRISVRQVWKLTSSGQLPSPIEIGRSTRWRDSDVQRVIRGEEGSR